MVSIPSIVITLRQSRWTLRNHNEFRLMFRDVAALFGRYLLIVPCSLPHRVLLLITFPIPSARTWTSCSYKSPVDVNAPATGQTSAM